MNIDIRRLPIALASLGGAAAVLALLTWAFVGLDTTPTGLVSGAAATLLVAAVVAAAVVRRIGRRPADPS